MKTNLRACLIWLIATVFVVYELFITNGFYAVSLALQQHELSLNSSALGLLASVSFVSYALCQVPAGILVSKYSVKIILSFAATLVGLGMLLYQNVTSLEMLLLARIVVAVGSAFAFVSVALLIGRWFSKDKFPVLFGLTQCSGNISVVAANMFLPEIINLVHGWRHVSWYLSLLGFALAIGLFLIVKTRPKAIQVTSTQVTQSTVSISQLFKILLTNQQFWIVTLFAGLLLGSLFNLGANWDISFQKSFSGNTLSSAALINSIMFLGLAVGNPLMGILSGKLKSRRKLLITGSLSAAIFLGVLLFAPQLNHVAAMVLYFGFGLCCSTAVLSYTVIMEVLPAEVQGVGIGVCNTVVYLSGALMSLVISSVLQIEIKFVQNILFSDRVALSLFFFAILQAFTISLFIKESYKS